jgi:uncharacterized RmlC-like cupin family protein
MTARVLRADRDFIPLALADGPGEARAVVWPGMGARHRTMHYLSLPAGGRTHALRHAASEAVYYIVQGAGVIEDLDARSAHPIRTGSVVWITPDSQYRIAAGPDAALVCVGGPCPPDPALYAGGPGRPIRLREASS